VLLRKRAATGRVARGTGIAARAETDKCLIPQLDGTAGDLPLREAAMKFALRAVVDFRTLSKQ